MTGGHILLVAEAAASGRLDDEGVSSFEFHSGLAWEGFAVSGFVNDGLATAGAGLAAAEAERRDLAVFCEEREGDRFQESVLTDGAVAAEILAPAA